MNINGLGFPSISEAYGSITSGNSEAFMTEMRNKTAKMVQWGMDTGELNAQHFQKALYQAFGQGSYGVVRPDDTIDYSALDALMGGEIARTRQSLLSTQLFSNTSEQQASIFSLFNETQNAIFDNLFDIKI